MQKRRFTIRVSLIVLITLSLVISSGLATFFSLLGAKKSTRVLMDHLLDEINDNFIAKSEYYLSQAVHTILFIKHTITNQLLHDQSTESINRFLTAVLETNVHIDSLSVITPAGLCLKMKRMSDGTFSLNTISFVKNKTYSKWKHQNPDWEKSYPGTVGVDESTYDPRTSWWYKNAAEQKGRVWTGAYITHIDHTPVISCAQPVYNLENGALDYVIGIDINLLDISHFLGNKIFGKSSIFILNSKDQIIGMPLKGDNDVVDFVRKDTTPDGMVSYRLASVEELGDETLARNYDHFNNVLEDVRKRQSTDGPLTFDICFNDEDYYAMYYSIRDQTPWDWRIVVIVPERFFMGEVYKNTRFTLFICGGVVIISIFFGIFISRRISQPISVLAGEMNKIGKFELESETKVYSKIAEINQMSGALEGMRSGLRSFKKYVPARLVRQLIKLKKEAVLGGEKRNITVCFSDIAGFTTISEKLTPEELVKDLYEYNSIVDRIVHRFNGTVDKFIGDSVMAFWGAPDCNDKHAVDACKAALEINNEIGRLAEKWKQEGKCPLRIRIGINTGELIVGNIGSEDRLNYTVIGDPVNLASRLEGVNKIYGSSIIIGKSTHDEVKDNFETRLLDYVVVKGKTRPVAIFELIAEKQNISEETREFLILFEKGIDLYLHREWDQASEFFRKALQINKNDTASQLYRGRCATFKLTPPSAQWTGEFVLKSK